MQVVVVGGGIVGLSSALYLQSAGCAVTVIDQNDFSDNCSYGNAGYVCPSHFVPLATPGIVKQGLKWMWNSRSPFYVQPRLDRHLMDWGLTFMRSATPAHVEKSAIPLRDIALLSKKMYETWLEIPGFDFAYEQKGLFEIFQTPKGEAKARSMYNKALELGLSDTQWLTAEALQALEPHARIQAMGAVLFQCDAHLYPQKLMRGLYQILHQRGVKFLPQEAVTGFETAGKNLKAVLTHKGKHAADAFVLATGAWSREMAAKLNLRLPLMPGRGYSITLENSPYRIEHPAVLVEGRAALTPMDGNKIRFGGTMEITPTSTPPRRNRVEGLLQAVRRFYPDFVVETPPMEEVWYGFRPCSADGLPYLGKPAAWQNLVVATGHSMIGLSLGAGTGLLVKELVMDQPTSMDVLPFAPDRFA